MARLVTLLLLMTLVVACGTKEEDRPAEEPTAAVSAVDHGRQLYVQYCQNCHGPEGLGDGPVAELLTIPPADLTLIAERASGPFPVDDVAAYIDGRSSIEGHGARTMPVWGNIWTDTEGGVDAEQRMAFQINELVEYLRTLQVDSSEM